MEKHIYCIKQGHNMPLDMICINAKCQHRGLLCHKCFMDFSHDHMGSEIRQVSKFIDSCQTALEKAKSNIHSTKDKHTKSVFEEYNSSKMLIENCKNKTEEIIKQLFDDLENRFINNFESLTDTIEKPKTDILNDIDKYRTYIKEMQSGLIDEVDEINTEILGIWKICQRNKANEFEIREELMMGVEGDGQEDHVPNFKKYITKTKQSLNQIQDWVKGRPRLEAAKKIQKESHEKIEEESDIPNMKGKENIPDIPTVLTGGKRPLPKKEIEEKIRGSEPLKKIKPNESKTLENERINSRKEINIPQSQPLLKEIPQLKSKKSEEPKDPYIKLKNGVNVSRFVLDDRNYEHFGYLDAHTITFSTEKDLSLLGFKHYNLFKPSLTAIFEYSLFEGEAADQMDHMMAPPKVLRIGTFNLNKELGAQTTVSIAFDRPLMIAKKKFYTLKVLNKTKYVEFFCYKGKNGVEKVPPFRFYPSQFSDLAQFSTNTKQGQIPEFVYSNEE